MRLRSGLCAGQTELCKPFSLWTSLCPRGHCHAEAGRGPSLICGRKVESMPLSKMSPSTVQQRYSSRKCADICVHIHIRGARVSLGKRKKTQTTSLFFSVLDLTLHPHSLREADICICRQTAFRSLRTVSASIFGWLFTHWIVTCVLKFQSS